MHPAGIVLAIIGPFMIYEVFRRLPWPDRETLRAFDATTEELEIERVRTSEPHAA